MRLTILLVLLGLISAASQIQEITGDNVHEVFDTDRHEIAT